MTVDSRLAALETLAQEARDRLDQLEAEVVTGEGIGPRLPLRSRVHNIESDRAAANAAHAALDALRSARRADQSRRLTYVNVALAAAAIIVPHFT